MAFLGSPEDPCCHADAAADAELAAGDPAVEPATGGPAVEPATGGPAAADGGPAAVDTASV